jgi:hypothetical protein
MSHELIAHFGTLLEQLKRGRVVPFLGAGANLCGRPTAETGWERGQYLPSGAELAEHLAKRFAYPYEDKEELARVAEYAKVSIGPVELQGALRELFDADYPPNDLHLLLAGLPKRLREKGYPSGLLIVTTNYDDVLERAFREAEEEFDLLIYMTPLQGEWKPGTFLHVLPGGKTIQIETANSYPDLPLVGLKDFVRPVIMKIHGAIGRAPLDRDSFVITEDDYIEYLAHSDISNLLPATVRTKLTESNFLFLGYSLRDWNLRAILYLIWESQRGGLRSWAVQRNPNDLDEAAWQERGVKIFDVSLEEYVAGLVERLKELSPADGEAS